MNPNQQTLTSHKLYKCGRKQLSFNPTIEGVAVVYINKPFDQIEWKTGSQKHQTLSTT